MARKETVVLISDLNGEEMQPGEGETVRFGLDGVDFEVDLFADQADELRKALADYVAVARRVGGRKQQAKAARVSSSSGSAHVDREQNQAVRDWAKSEGYEINPRGRIPGRITEAYEQAHSRGSLSAVG